MDQDKSFWTKLRGIVWLIHQVDAGMLPVQFCYVLLIGILPYLNTGFLGVLLIMLQHRARPAQIVALLLAFLAVRLGLTVLQRVVEKLQADHHQLLGQRLEALTAEKLVRLDYQDFESKDLRAAYDTARRGASFSGDLGALVQSGFYHAFNMLIAAGFAIGILVTLLRGHVTESKFAWLFNSPWYLVVILAVLALPLLLSVWGMRRGSVKQREMIQKIVAHNVSWQYYNDFAENFKNGELTRLYDADGMMSRAEEKALDAGNQATWHGMMGMFGATAVPSGVIQLAVGGLFVLVGLQAYAGGLAIGTVLIAVGYLQQFMLAFDGFIGELGYAVNEVNYLQYYVTLLKMPTSHTGGTLPVEKRTDNDFAIAFHDVSFKYPDSDEWALRHINLTLHIGERLAIVGKNGSGKTTLVKLLCRLFTPTEGEITLNDIDIQKYDLAEYQSLLGVVFQDFRLFAYSIGENVAASTQVDEARVWQALAVADITDRVKAMPKGLATPITKSLFDDGIDISGGEAQKIAIARAWYKDAPIMILDEPTAALDPISEYEIYQRFDALVGDKTAIYISHRMSSTRFSQRIVVFDQGQIVQDGNHESLMKQDGLYRQLFNAQAQYYTDDKIKEERQQGLQSAAPVVK
ncbi:ABC transporter ATP-binding protein [Lacticaseibacillus camelliae]|uniref:Abc-type multidrug transport system atpase and permease component n=1 Tax=Lacticaseibacillus camelliae DSM 22697 = JCM 13995 TaxID=1423730 RepID=A0A0R2F5U2_9LACO|nr:ABC transporter ATP-binding protein [Lacticaseibacillus camelliae]KRN23791.1 abc-type multidrug transport system atpase and permease component [Lacticaseibacillus camelliae DSM 22697 = JCM 13995]